MPRRLPLPGSEITISEASANVVRYFDGAIDVTEHIERLARLRRESELRSNQEQLAALINAAKQMRREIDRLKAAGARGFPRHLIVYECPICHEPNLASSRRDSRGWKCIDSHCTSDCKVECEHKWKVKDVKVVKRI